MRLSSSHRLLTALTWLHMFTGGLIGTLTAPSASAQVDAGVDAATSMSDSGTLADDRDGGDASRPAPATAGDASGASVADGDAAQARTDGGVVPIRLQSADALAQQAEITQAQRDQLKEELEAANEQVLVAAKDHVTAQAALAKCREQADAGTEQACLEQVALSNLALKYLAAKERLAADAEGKFKEADAQNGKVRAELEDSQGFHRLLGSRLRGARRVRCMTAICWGGTKGNPYKYGIEPLVDLPIGIVWSVGKGALSSYMNSNVLNVEFNAGLRIWLMYDKLSFSLYFAKPVARKGDTIRLPGSAFEHSVESIHRPFPSFAIGVLGDTMQIGIAYDVLVNGSGTRQDPEYPPNKALSRSLTFTLGFSTLTAMRNAAGMAAEKKKEEEASK